MPKVNRHLLQVEEGENHCQNIRRSRYRDLRITADDDRVAMMTGVVPSPGNGFTQHHERSDFIERVIQPICLEGRSMAALMPTGVRAGSINGTVRQEGKDRPPRS